MGAKAPNPCPDELKDGRMEKPPASPAPPPPRRDRPFANDDRAFLVRLKFLAESGKANP